MKQNSLSGFPKLLILVTAFCSMLSCKKFLDAKPNEKLVVPATLQDAQALLDAYPIFNSFYPSMAMQSDDDFYLLDTYWATMSPVNQLNYIWDKNNFNEFEWGYLYQMVLNANTAMETLSGIIPTATTKSDWNRLMGAGLFFRSYAFFEIAENYATPYDKVTATQALGIPLRLSSDISEVSVRATLEETYSRITGDLKAAAAILPVTTSPVSRPSKPAALAALARVYLSMQEYSLASLYADSCLQLYSQLIDYNTVSASASIPFTRFNTEVLFPAIIVGPGMLNVSNWKEDSLLYSSYLTNDLRKGIFYQSNGTGTFGFKGSYDGSTTRFSGIATDEIYLIRAESRARAGDKDGALSDLNALMIKRWKTGTFVPFTATSADDALSKILIERRKELVLRGRRWSDLRRLNKEPRFAKTLTRMLNGQVYQLPPNDPRYTQYIPQSVIDMTGLPQNSR